MQRSLCNICWLIYVPTAGNVVRHSHDHPACVIYTATQREQLPDDWSCAVCHITKEDVQQLDVVSNVNLESSLCSFQS